MEVGFNFYETKDFETKDFELVGSYWDLFKGSGFAPSLKHGLMGMRNYVLDVLQKNFDTYYGKGLKIKFESRPIGEQSRRIPLEDLELLALQLPDELPDEVRELIPDVEFIFERANPSQD